MHLEPKRKADDQLGSESPSKRIKSSHSHTITPEIEGKARVVPFPEKVCYMYLSLSEDISALTVVSSLPWQRNAMAISSSAS